MAHIFESFLDSWLVSTKVANRRRPELTGSEFRPASVRKCQSSLSRMWKLTRQDSSRPNLL